MVHPSSCPWEILQGEAGQALEGLFSDGHSHTRMHSQQRSAWGRPQWVVPWATRLVQARRLNQGLAPPGTSQEHCLQEFTAGPRTDLALTQRL